MCHCYICPLLYRIYVVLEGSLQNKTQYTNPIFLLMYMGPKDHRCGKETTTNIPYILRMTAMLHCSLLLNSEY